MMKFGLSIAAIFCFATVAVWAQQYAANGIPPSVTSVTATNRAPGIRPSVTSVGMGWGGAPQYATAESDSNPLQPPKGYKVALVEFADYECPDCANAEPILESAERTYHIPLVRYEFPLVQIHPWAKDAAIMALFFDSKSKALGTEWRKYCFEHQPYPDKQLPQIHNPAELQQAAQHFAAEHKIALPMSVDPEGKLDAQVAHDIELGQSIGLTHTPTIYVVTNSSQTKPFVEVVDRRNLFSQIDEMISEAGGVRDAAAPHRTPKGHAAAKKTR